ncbi:MAG: PorV/PorQ family protein [Candidatus Marinimicrobia bacterium]|nr:PorV/PorQ family protein [Candidatus Neomarinimicrobiota bacterium]
MMHKHSNGPHNNLSNSLAHSGKILALVVLMFGFINQLSADKKKLGQTGFQFLSVSTNARGAALSNAMTTAELGASSLFYNPAGMSRMNSLINITVCQNQWIDDINYNSVGLALSPQNGRYGVIGISLIAIDYGTVMGTMVWENDAGFIETGELHPTAAAVSVGYARSLSDRFSIGGNLKYAGQYLGKSVIKTAEDSLTTRKNIASATAFDFGTIYQTGFNDFAFGMSVRNFSNEIKFEKESFQLPLTFTIGISIDMLQLIDRGSENHSMRVSLDLAHPRSYPEQVDLGIEYAFNQSYFIRTGFAFNSDERNISFGGGLALLGLTVDYAYTPFGVFNNVQRFTLQWSL